MDSEKWLWSIDTTLHSRRGAHLPLMQQILEQLTAAGWSSREIFGIQMALEESLSNAIRHGNGCDPAKLVRVSCRLNQQRFWLDVEDEGEGFSQEEVPDCTAPENLCMPGGRGLLLMQAYMTWVKYNETGNRVTMEKIRDESAEKAHD